MPHLYQLPAELLQHVLQLLPRSDVAKLCLSSRRFYEIGLPTLYTHLELSFRAHIHQLEMGLHHRPLLRDIVARHTKQLTLVCRQSGSNMSDFCNLLTKLPNIRTLTCVDFHVLFTESVCQLVHYCDQLSSLHFRYCNLVSTAHNIDELLSPLSRVKQLSLTWTDFSEMAIGQLLSCLPNLASVDFGANHNRIRTANDSALNALTQHCLSVTDLAVSLQQIEDESLCDVIAFYGNRLTQLSIRCEPTTITAIANCCTSITRLTLRAAGQRQNTHTLLHLLHRCRRLDLMELEGWLIQDIPSVVWSVVAKRLGGDSTVDDWRYYLDDDALPQQQNGPILQIGHLKKTLVLRKQELRDVRKSLASA